MNQLINKWKKWAVIGAAWSIMSLYGYAAYDTNYMSIGYFLQDSIVFKILFAVAILPGLVSEIIFEVLPLSLSWIFYIILIMTGVLLGVVTGYAYKKLKGSKWISQISK